MPAVRGDRSVRRERLGWIAAGIALVSGIAGVAATVSLRTAPDVPESRVEINTPPTLDIGSFAVSPDGRSLAFVALQQGQLRLWVRPFSTGTAQPIGGTEGASYPFWSPDGRSLGFFADSRLKRVDLAGGAPQSLAPAPGPRGGTWGAGDTIVFAPMPNAELQRMSAAGGVPAPATRRLGGQNGHRFPKFLADGRHYIYYAQSGDAAVRGTFLASLESTDARRLLGGIVAAVPAAHDTILVTELGKVFARRFDVDALELEDDPAMLAEDVSIDSPLNLAALSAGGSTVAFRTGRSLGVREIVWFDRSGKRLGTVGDQDAAAPRVPELSPDDRWIAVYRSVPGNDDVWLVDAATGARRRFTFDAGNDLFPVWCAGGTQLVFTSNRAGPYNLFVKPASGAGQETLLLASDRNKVPMACSPDGRYLLYRVTDPRGTTSGRCRCRETARPCRSRRSRTTSARGSSRPTAAGWHISRTSRAGSRSTCSRSPAPPRSSRSRWTAAPSRAGAPTARSCTTSRSTDA
jgi:Tol biopolymer transport system component